MARPELHLFVDNSNVCTPEEQDALVAAIRGAQLMVYEGSGHALHWEDPQRFATDLAAFVAARLGPNTILLTYRTRSPERTALAQLDLAKS